MGQPGIYSNHSFVDTCTGRSKFIQFITDSIRILCHLRSYVGFKTSSSVHGLGGHVEKAVGSGKITLMNLELGF
jgi:hypothetical protein